MRSNLCINCERRAENGRRRGFPGSLLHAACQIRRCSGRKEEVVLCEDSISAVDGIGNSLVHRFTHIDHPYEPEAGYVEAS